MFKAPDLLNDEEDDFSYSTDSSSVEELEFPDAIAEIRMNHNTDDASQVLHVSTQPGGTD